MLTTPKPTFITLLPSLRNAKKHSNLPISPTDLDPISIIVIICIFIARTLKSSLGFGTPFVPIKPTDDVSSTNATSFSQEQDFSLPDLTLSMPLEYKPTHAELFTRAINPTSTSISNPDDSIDITGNNAQLCLFLASLSEPAMLLLLAKQNCPVRPLGAVNVRNRFELLEPDLCRSIFNSATSVSGSTPEREKDGKQSMSVLARFSGPAHGVKRGIEINIEVDIVLTPSATSPSTRLSPSADPVVIFRQIFTMLQFTKSTSSSRSRTSQPLIPSSATQTQTPTSQQLQVTLSMPSSSPYAWAKLCKDYNPIHFSGLLAKILGQPGQLAHGNHVVGCVVHGLSTGEHVVGEWVGSDVTLAVKVGKERWYMETRFRRPVVLPARIGAVMRDGKGFDVVDGKSGKVCIEVEVGLI